MVISFLVLLYVHVCAVCLDGSDPVDCRDTCDGRNCPNVADARCIPDDCNNCRPVWYLDGNDVSDRCETGTYVHHVSHSVLLHVLCTLEGYGKAW